MWVFNEGVPRSGKSYDCVANHVLPAIVKGRHVWARINGLETPECRQAIAKHLGLPLEHVEKYLHHVETKDVVTTFAASQDPETQRWVIADDFKNALVIIDEVHEFYVEGRAPLPPAVENFFALFGQNGGDGIIMTQFWKRLHEAIRARVERKHSFQKLTAFGMEGSYRVTFNHSVSAGKFQKVGSKVAKYDPKIFPLYHGYAPGATNTEVYKEGSVNVWRMVLIGAIPMLIVFAVGAYVFIGFFRNGFGQAESSPVTTPATSAPSAVGQVFKPGAVVPAPGQVADVVVPPPDPLEGLEPAQRYVAELAKLGRVRVAAMAYVDGKGRAWLEWVDTGNNPVESLDTNQLQDMGFSVEFAGYGVKLTAADHTIIATAWPRRPNVREVEARTYNTREAGLVDGGGAGVRVSAQSAATVASTGTVVGYAPGHRADVFPRSPGYAAESWTGPTSTL